MGLSALGYYVVNTPNAARVPDEIRRQPSEAPPAIEKPATPSAAKATVVLPFIRNEKVVMNDTSVTVPTGVNPKLFLGNEILIGLEIPGAKVLGVEVKSGVAAIDFNRGIEKGYGSMQESQLVESFQLGFGQFAEIDSIQLFVEGKPIESLGHLELNAPLPVIRGEQLNPANSSEVPPTP